MAKFKKKVTFCELSAYPNADAIHWNRRPTPLELNALDAILNQPSVPFLSMRASAMATTLSASDFASSPSFTSFSLG